MSLPELNSKDMFASLPDELNQFGLEIASDIITQDGKEIPIRYVRTQEDRAVNIIGVVVSPDFVKDIELISWWNTIKSIFIDG